MKNITILLIVIFVISTSWIASTAEPELESVPEITYGDGWVKSCTDIKCNTTYGITTYKLYNGSYTPEPVQSIAPVVNNYSIIYNGGEIRTIWDGVLRYDMILDPDTGAIISPWSMWKVESFRTTGKGEWQEEIPVSSTFTMVNSNTLINEMILGSGGKFNITYRNLGTKIKFDLDLTAGYNRNYRLTYRIDAAAGQDLDPSSKKYTPGFFDGFTVYDWTDVPPYTVDVNGTYLYGYNTSEWLDQTGRKFYQTIAIPKKLNVSERVIIDPSWTVGSGGSAWGGNSSFDNTTSFRDDLYSLNGTDNENIIISNLYNSLPYGLPSYPLQKPYGDNKSAYRIYARKNITIDKIYTYTLMTGTPGSGTVELQYDDGTSNHFPNGTVMSTYERPSLNGWATWSLATPVQLTSGEYYHIVIYNTSWTASNYQRMYFNAYTDNVYNEKLEYYDGTSWGLENSGSSRQSIYFVSNNSCDCGFGVPLNIEDTSPGDRYNAERILFNQPVTIYEVAFQGRSVSAVGNLAINITYTNGTQIAASDLGYNYIFPSDNYAVATFDPPVTLDAGTYDFRLTSYNMSSGTYRPRYQHYPVLELSYDGSNSVMNNNGDLQSNLLDMYFWINRNITRGNTTHWHDSGSGNETYQIDVNATTPVNTNYTVWYRQNGTGSYSQLGGTLTGNNSLAITTKYQDTEVQVRLAGTGTVTPEIMSVTFYTQSSEAPDTSFSVSLPEGYTYITFNAPNSTVQNLYPDGQTLSISFFNFTNGGNVAQSFRFYFNSTITGITTYGDLDSNHSSGKIEINTSTTTVVVPSLSIGSSQNVWMLIDTDRPVPQDTNITLTINSS